MTATAQNPDGKKSVTLEEYFEFEYKAERRHEFIGGKIVAMAYTSEERATIVHNIDVILGICLLEKDCKVYPGDRMLSVRDCNDVFYPDLLIVCGKHEFYQATKNMKATLNPSVVIKVFPASNDSSRDTYRSRYYKQIHSLRLNLFALLTAHPVYSITSGARNPMTIPGHENERTYPPHHLQSIRFRG